MRSISNICHALRDIRTCSYGNSCKVFYDIREPADTSDTAGGGEYTQGADDSAGTYVGGRIIFRSCDKGSC